jgi:rhodanese-related sulfurtransferase
MFAMFMAKYFVFLLIFQPTARDLSDLDFFNVLVSTPHAIILDVQTNEEYLEYHIFNALNIPSKDKLVKMCDSLDRASQIFIYCLRGERSKTAMNLMTEMGFKNIYNLKDGIRKAVKNPVATQYHNLIFFRKESEARKK